MPETETVEEARALNQPREQQREYDWLGAIECCRKAKSLAAEPNSLRRSETCERMGYFFFRAAMQAESSSEFKNRWTEAIKCYERSKDSYAALGSTQTLGRVRRCESMIAYLHFWLASELGERKRLIELAWKFAKEALHAFSESGENREFGRTWNQLSMSACFRFEFQTDQSERETTVHEAIRHGELAITLLSSSADVWELSTAYAQTALFLGWLGQYFLDLEERARCTKRSLRYWSRAVAICEEAAFVRLFSMIPEAPFHFWGVGTAKSIEKLNKGLEYAKKTKDRFALGCVFDWLAFNLYWKATACENLEEKLQVLREALQSAHNAKSQYAPISFTSTRGFSNPIEVADAVYKCELSNLEVNIQRRRRLLEEAEEAARAGLARLELAGYPFAILMAQHELSKALVWLARIEIEPLRKKGLLEEALNYRILIVEGFKRLLPFHYFDQGFMIGFLVDVKCELAEITENEEAKRKILEQAVVEKANSVELGVKYASYYEKVGAIPLVVDVCRWQFEYASLLGRLHSLNKDQNCLKKEIIALKHAAESLSGLGLMGRAAECVWKIAQTHEALGQESEAAVDFDVASGYYSKAGSKMPQLEDFYQKKAFYMQAWREICKAKHCHRRREYGKARRHFEKAANMHKKLEQWCYYAPNYLALAKVDHAEELSSKENCNEAIKAFKQAATLFGESKKSIQKELGRIEDKDERQMATVLLKASDLRRKYCMARVSVENARVLEKNGEYYASAEEYGSVTEVFETIAEELESEEDMKEFRFVAVLSKAWQKMMLAEERDLPALYAESAQIFEKASENGSSDVARFLTLGHSRFCRALEAASRYLDGQEMTAYSTAMQYLQSATRYYKMAGLKNSVDHTRATELLMQAYVHVNNAKREVDPEKKARLFKMAGVILQESYERFASAKHQAKKNQVLSLLKTVKEEHEWALSCVQVLRTPPLVSAGYFPAPTPTSERAVGLNEFEHANIQLYLSASKEAFVGDELSIQLDFINVAKSFGLLLRVEQLIPSNLKVIASDPNLRIEDGSLDLRGKRLEPLKVESIKINAEPAKPGLIMLNPKLIFVDDSGRFRTCKPKAIRVTVKPRQSFEFRVRFAESILRFLASSFVKDTETRMPIDRCGWRSLVDVMKYGKVPRSSVYKTGGGRGLAIAELEKLGFVETRVSSGERGRGGNILKLRICYEKEEVKRYAYQNRLSWKEKQDHPDL